MVGLCSGGLLAIFPACESQSDKNRGNEVPEGASRGRSGGGLVEAQTPNSHTETREVPSLLSQPCDRYHSSASPRGSRAGVMGRREERRERDPIQLAMLLLLLTKLYDQYRSLPVRPGLVTTALATLLIIIHLVPGVIPFSTSEVCISTSAVWQALFATERWSWLFGQRGAADRISEVMRRLILSTLLHVDDLHLYYNTASLLWKGSALEDRMGIDGFGRFLAFAVFASGSLAVLLGRLAEQAEWGTLNCAVGLSGVLYAASAVIHQQCPDEPAIVRGIPIRRKHAVWLDVVISSLMHAHVHPIKALTQQPRRSTLLP